VKLPLSVCITTTRVTFGKGKNRHVVSIPTIFLRTHYAMCVSRMQVVKEEIEPIQT